jgi:molecular chaperone DnaK
LETLKGAHLSKNIAGIDSAMEGLNKAWEAASQEIYNGQGAGGAQPGPDANAGAGEGTTGDGVSDVDYEEVSEDKK